MSERPILMSGAMVRATLANLKTQHRVAITPHTVTVLGRTPDPSRSALEYPNGWLGLIWENAWIDGHRSDNQPNGLFGCGRNKGKSCGEYLHVPLPDGRSFRIRSKNQPGDQLWLCERGKLSEDKTLFIYGAAPGICKVKGWDRESDYHPAAHAYKSALSPRWASRITLEITEVRAQRLQEISNADAKAEGLSIRIGDGTGRGPGYKWNGEGFFDHVSRDKDGCPTYHVAKTGEDYCRCREGQRLSLTPARCAYRVLWDSINAKRDGGIYAWSAHAWVFALSFRRMTP